MRKLDIFVVSLVPLAVGLCPSACVCGQGQQEANVQQEEGRRFRHREHVAMASKRRTGTNVGPSNSISKGKAVESDPVTFQELQREGVGGKDLIVIFGKAGVADLN